MNIDNIYDILNGISKDDIEFVVKAILPMLSKEEFNILRTRLENNQWEILEGLGNWNNRGYEVKGRKYYSIYFLNANPPTIWFNSTWDE